MKNNDHRTKKEILDDKVPLDGWEDHLKEEDNLQGIHQHYWFIFITFLANISQLTVYKIKKILKTNHFQMWMCEMYRKSKVNSVQQIEEAHTGCGFSSQFSINLNCFHGLKFRMLIEHNKTESFIIVLCFFISCCFCSLHVLKHRS